jgi:hypothetical protein
MEQQDFYSRMNPKATAQRGGRARVLVAGMLAAFLLGGATVGLLAWGKLLPGFFGSRTEPAPAVASPPPMPSASEQPSDKTTVQAVAKVAQQQGGLESRVVAMEQRLTALDLRAQAASGNAARAEGLLIAFAARRAIERGAPLGYLGEQLKLRFGDSHPNAVKAVLAESEHPVTTDQLKDRLDGLAPQLVDETEGGISWAWFKRQVGELFIVRSGETPSPAPENRLDRARRRLDNGQVEVAIGEVRQLPGAPAAQQWIADAERYAAAEGALDQLETAAVLEPRDLRDAAGQKVQQPSPAGAAKN